MDDQCSFSAKTWPKPVEMDLENLFLPRVTGSDNLMPLTQKDDIGYQTKTI